MPVVNLICHLPSCNTDILCIKYDAHVSIFHMWCIGRFILALKHNGYLRSQPSKHLSHRQFTSHHILLTIRSFLTQTRKNNPNLTLSIKYAPSQPIQIDSSQTCKCFLRISEMKQASVLILDINMVLNCRFRNNISVT